jgi:hypothetical protein
VDYLVESGPSIARHMEDNVIVVFCIDTSGSMTVTSPIDAKDGEKMNKLRKKALERGGQQQQQQQQQQPAFTTIEGDATSQCLPREKRGTMYVSRLEAVQAAMEAQLYDLQQKHPNRRVLLVTFSSEVVVFGDGTHNPITLAGDMLHSAEDLSNLGQWAKPMMTKNESASSSSSKTEDVVAATSTSINSTDKSLADSFQPILDSRITLSTKLFSLREEGQTALGPALLVSYALASQVPGSKVVLCTDGLANVGVGAMDTDSPAASVRDFYINISKRALESNTTISLMSFKGSDSNIQVLGEMATKTGGQVDIVDPARIYTNLQAIFADDTLATDVHVKLIMRPGCRLQKSTIKSDDWTIGAHAGASGDNQLAAISLPKNTGISSMTTLTSDSSSIITELKDTKGKGKIADEDSLAEADSSSATVEDCVQTEDKGDAPIYSKHLGSVNSDSNLLMEYETDPSLLSKGIERVPFQLQITHTRVEDGKRLMRVIVASLQVTDKRETAETEADPEVLGLNAVRRVAQTALTGEYTRARLQNYAYLQLMKRVVKVAKSNSDEAKEVLSSYVTHNKRFEVTMRREQVKELRQGKKWDELEGQPEMEVEEEEEQQKQEQESSFSGGGFLSGFWSFFGGGGSTRTTVSTTINNNSSVVQKKDNKPKATNVNVAEIRSQRSGRTDEVSNVLWNMNAANML